MEGCVPYTDEKTGKEGYPYKEALEHQKVCLYRQRFCKHGCGQKILGHEIEAHEEKCPEKLEACEKCSCKYKVNLVSAENKHDCIEAMKAQVKQCDNDMQKIKETYGINYDVMNNKCPKKQHPLKVHVGIVRSYPGNPCCDDCGQADLQEHEFFYRCDDDECKYDLCRLCALHKCNPPVLKKWIRTSEHDCKLERREANHAGTWNCDISHQEAGAGIRCESAIPAFRLTKHMQGYRCVTHNFDLCLKCALRYQIKDE